MKVICENCNNICEDSDIVCHNCGLNLYKTKRSINFPVIKVSVVILIILWGIISLFLLAKVVIKDLSNRKESSIETDADWVSKFYVGIDGNNIILPVKVSDLEDTLGLVCQESEDLKSKEEKILDFINSDGISIFSVNVVNDSDSTLSIKDCYVKFIYQYDVNIMKGAYPIDYPEDLKVGDKINKNDLFKLLGKPDEYHNNKYLGDDYTFISEDFSKCYSVMLKDNEVVMLALYCGN